MSKGVELSEKYIDWSGEEFKGLDFYRKRVRNEYPELTGDENYEEIALEAWHTDIRRAVAALEIPERRNEWKEEEKEVEREPWKPTHIHQPDRTMILGGSWYVVESQREVGPGQFLIHATKKGKL